jgi:hypothetical protein
LISLDVRSGKEGRSRGLSRRSWNLIVPDPPVGVLFHVEQLFHQAINPINRSYIVIRTLRRIKGSSIHQQSNRSANEHDSNLVVSFCSILPFRIMPLDLLDLD